MASWKRMLEILDEPPAIADPRAVAFDLALAKGRVEFRGLNYSRRPPGARRHRPSDRAGQTVAVVGPTGSGRRRCSRR
jgi:ABC-type multidrug transport system fused ATPase/permease subunit